MGATLVAKVLTHWTHVSDRAFRVLVRMALTALDRPTDDTPAATYFAGRELLAMTFRTDKGTDQSRYRNVARVVAELIELGAIERVDGGRTGHNAVFRLTLNRGEVDLEDPVKGGQFSHPQGGQISPPQGGQFSPDRVANLATPRSHEEPLEELKEEEVVEVRPTSHPPRATAKPPDPTPSGTVVELFRTRKWSTRGADTVAAATAARAQRVAEYQAQLAAREETS